MAIEWVNWDVRIGTNENVDAFDSGVGPFLHDQFGKPPVATTNIEDFGVLREKRRHPPGENAHAPAVNQIPV
jgi:hypothetical protein